MYDEDPLKRHSSLTWLQQSSHIISKVLQPVFKVLGADHTESDYIDMYKILKTIIMNEEREFCVFLFSQKEHYLNVLLARLFQDLGRFSPTKDSGLKGSGVSGTGTSTLAKSSSLINTNTS
jgi:hypothetical protein